MTQAIPPKGSFADYSSNDLHYRVFQRRIHAVPKAELERMVIQAAHFERVAQSNQGWIDGVLRGDIIDDNLELDAMVEVVEESRRSARILRKAVEFGLEPAGIDLLDDQVACIEAYEQDFRVGDRVTQTGF